jgi:hypothetical protein
MSDLLEMAQDPLIAEERFPRIADFYRSQHDPSNPLHYCDKSQINIWFVERLAKEFPGSKFVGIQRDPYGVVASMLMHSPSLEGLFINANKYPLDNPLLGLTSEMEPWKLSRIGQAALRWKSSTQRMKQLLGTENIFVVSYHELQLYPRSVLDDLRDFLELYSAFSVPYTKAESLDQWKKVLTEKDIEDIDRIIGEI